jgi:hypothetical protein
MSIIKKILSSGTKDVIGAVEKVLDQVITNKEELAQAKLEAEKEINRHFESVQSALLKEKELDVQDRQTARNREAEFVKATGHIDYLMWFLAIAGMIVLSYCLYVMTNHELENKELFIHFLGIIEGVVVSIYSYFFGSSAGSRIKDMK